MTHPLDSLNHVAVASEDIAASVSWYERRFHCRIAYQDESWAMLEFANMRLALVSPEQHPGHVAISRSDAASFGRLATHRDGTRYVYLRDPSGNCVEVLQDDSQRP